MKKIYVLVLLCFIINYVKAVNDLLAHYPLTSDGVDITGNNDTIRRENAPFQDGGIYCDGDYTNTRMETPRINNFSFTSLSVSFDFKADEYKTRPVIICGIFYRWLGLYLDSNGTVAMRYNNSNIESSSLTYTPNQWHSALITYDGTTAKLYIDGSLAASKTVVLDYNVNDTEISTKDYSYGLAFKGVIRNLKISNSAYYGICERNELKLDLYPNPVQDLLILKGMQPNSIVSIYAMNGNLIKTIPWNNEPIHLQSISEGMYMIRVDDVNNIYSGRFIKQ